ncbi:hypothetical protein PAHAL_1G251800 [Panicum hallii]|uniref:Uncharacterized protein n=1 Tax=Panicum hallii TaxID=206008 RepID=A0A2T8KWF2_9POAL|nr:hypothetical protein PAHAL_1G251800 [Panicum hallii]
MQMSPPHPVEIADGPRGLSRTLSGAWIIDETFPPQLEKRMIYQWTSFMLMYLCKVSYR